MFSVRGSRVSETLKRSLPSRRHFPLPGVVSTVVKKIEKLKNFPFLNEQLLRRARND